MSSVIVSRHHAVRVESGRKGGLATVRNMSIDECKAKMDRARKARLTKMTAARRKEIAQGAAQARWSKRKKEKP